MGGRRRLRDVSSVVRTSVKISGFCMASSTFLRISVQETKAGLEEFTDGDSGVLLISL